MDGQQAADEYDHEEKGNNEVDPTTTPVFCREVRNGPYYTTRKGKPSRAKWYHQVKETDWRWGRVRSQESVVHYTIKERSMQKVSKSAQGFP